MLGLGRKRKLHSDFPGQPQYIQKNPLPFGEFGHPVRHFNKKIQKNIQAIGSKLMEKYLQVILTGAGMRFKNLFNTVDKSTYFLNRCVINKTEINSNLSILA